MEEAMKGRKRKHQAGSIWLRGANWFVRYYGPDKKQRTEFLCAKDQKHHSGTCKPVRDLQAKVMARVNSGLSRGSKTQAVRDFW